MKPTPNHRTLAACIAILSVAAHSAHAQNDPAPRTDDVPIVIPYAPPAEEQTGAAADGANASPVAPALSTAQRREAQRRAQEGRVRELMAGFGVMDTAVQDALLAHIGAQVRARTRVRQLGVKLYQALRRPALADDDVRRLMADYQAALEADRGERAGAEEALNDRIHFRDQPRLEAMLMLFGIIGDNPLIMPFGLNRPPNGRRTANSRSAANAQTPAGRSQPEQRARLSAPQGLDGNQTLAVRPDDATLANRVQADEAGETVIGTVAARPDDGIEVRLDDGTLRRFLPRATADPDAPDGGLDGEMLRALATFEVGQRVRLRWIEEEQPRIIAIEKLDAVGAF